MPIFVVTQCNPYISMNLIRYIILLLFSFSVVGNAVESKSSKKNKLLVISSYSPVRKVSSLTVSAFARQLKTDAEADIDVEYLDSEANPDYTEWIRWMSSLFHAYPRRPELVVIIGQEAWSAYHVACPHSWKEIPVVLGHVKRGSFHFESGEEKTIDDVKEIKKTASTFAGFKVTGYYITDYIEENLRYIKQLQPEVRHVLFFYDDRYRLPFFEKYLLEIGNRVDSLRIHYIAGSKYSTAQLLDSIKAADNTYALLSAGWYTDVNRYPHAYPMLQNELERHPEKAVYQLYDQGFVADNCVGGYFVPGEMLGENLSALVKHILKNGFENSDSFRATPSPPVYTLNYQKIAELGIRKKDLPAGVVFFNMPDSFVKTHSVALLVLSLVFVAMAFIIYGSWFYRRRKERIYRQSYEKTQQLLAKMPDTVVVYSADLTIIDVINPLEDVLFGLERTNLIGKTIPDLMQENPAFREAGEQILAQLQQTYRTKNITAINYTVHTERGVAHVHLRVTPFEGDKLLTFAHNITDRINNEREVLKLKSFLQSVIDNLPVPVFVKDVANDFHYIYYNDRYRDFYDDLIKKHREGKDSEAAGFLKNRYREEDVKVLETGKPMTFDRVIYNERNEPCRWGITTKTRFQHSDGSYYIIAVLMETTELRKKQMEMDTIRKELSLALEAGSLSAWIYDVNTRIFTSLYGQTVSKAGLDYEEIEAIAHPDDRAKYRKFMEALAAGEMKKQREIFRFYEEDGYSWFETYAIGLRSAETGTIDSIVGTQKNITQEIEAEEKAKADKIKSDLAIQSSGIMQWDYDVRTCTFISPNEESFIYNRHMPKEKYFSFICSDDVHLYETALDTIIRGKSRTAHFQLRQNRPSIGVRWAEIHCVACEYDDAGNVVKITGLWRDITDMKKLIDELAAKEKAEELNRLKSAFLANMSHEIRTPLNAIVGFSNLMAQTDDPQEKAEFNKIIETNNELLLQLINDILDLSKIEVGQLDFVFTEVDVIRLMANLEAIYRFKLKEGVKLVCSFPDRACVVYSEKNRLTQVVSNFLSNACKFTFSGAIRMGYEHISGGLRFYVSDTGKGIKKENLPYVFDRFAKFDSFIQGTGLGLSICQTIVQHLKGEIGVDSEPGKGSTFWFTVPCEIRNVQGTAPQVTEPLPAVQAGTPDRVHTVLVAEDNDSNYLLLSKILGKQYNLVRALNGKEAVALFRQVRPDLVLMDIKMPEMNGIAATQVIRRADKQVAIIALTAHAFDQDKEEALQAGCNGFLTKPVHIPELKALIRKFIP